MSDSTVDLEIARPKLSELEVLVDLWTELVADQQQFGTRLRPVGNEANAQTWIGARMTQDGVRIARVDGSIVGFVTFERLPDQFSRSAQDGLVHNLYVIPACQGRGIGSALLERAETILYDRGVDRMTLEVLEENVDAHTFYENRGYHTHRRVFAKSLDETDTDYAEEPEA